MLLLLLLLASMLIDRLRIQRAVDMLDRPRSAERGRPAEVVAEVDELQEVSDRELLLSDCLSGLQVHCG